MLVIILYQALLPPSTQLQNLLDVKKIIPASNVLVLHSFNLYCVIFMKIVHYHNGIITGLALLIELF